MEVRGGRGTDRWLPHLLGHEGSGVVLATGAGVTKVKPGDEVILGWLKGTGLDAPGAKFSCDGITINSGGVTTFSQHTVVAENRLVKIPAKLPADVAVLFGCALPTGAGMVLNELRPAAGGRGAVLGLGGIGLSALMALSTYQCARLIAIDVSDEKLAFARELGATDLINSTREDPQAAVAEIAPGGLDFCVESGGSVATIELGFALIRKGGGRLLFASHPPEGEAIRLDPHELISGKQIAGSWGGASQPDRDIPRIADALRAGNVPLERLLTHRYRLEQINEALNELEHGRAFRPLIVMNDAD
jgi:S-(hydroxymethyl)glutathione dehydrogenase/alcohol dehydrogenase